MSGRGTAYQSQGQVKKGQRNAMGHCAAIVRDFTTFYDWYITWITIITLQTHFNFTDSVLVLRVNSIFRADVHEEEFGL